jgi:hypothetical protein
VSRRARRGRAVQTDLGGAERRLGVGRAEAAE